MKNVTLERKKDGYFVGSNFRSTKSSFAKTDFDPHDMSASANARMCAGNNSCRE